ncbi:MAG: hypothetical protein AVDCRST_MAG09-720 [uncultured Sphingomonas sp.]|uniref:Uncharacterized protein n=2 Tax=uncultured Sphingomonas sp. TaxID=158754 RepID=A0A6J4SDM8_9SPHN|nr:MAG: hypothetical protein AVDCRST_MAG09-720 [uncultured Sphingomonas sp.]
MKPETSGVAGRLHPDRRQENPADLRAIDSAGLRWAEDRASRMEPMLHNEHRHHHLHRPYGSGAPNDPELDSIVHKAASVCRTSMALISFVDEQRR